MRRWASALCFCLACACGRSALVVEDVRQTLDNKQRETVGDIMAQLLRALDSEERELVRGVTVEIRPVVGVARTRHLKPPVIEFGSETLAELFALSDASDRNSGIALILAHELGHVILDDELRRRPPEEIERAADLFAFRILASEYMKPPRNLVFASLTAKLGEDFERAKKDVEACLPGSCRPEAERAASICARLGELKLRDDKQRQLWWAREGETQNWDLASFTLDECDTYASFLQAAGDSRWSERIAELRELQGAWRAPPKPEDVRTHMEIWFDRSLVMFTPTLAVAYGQVSDSDGPGFGWSMAYGGRGFWPPWFGMQFLVTYQELYTSTPQDDTFAARGVSFEHGYSPPILLGSDRCALVPYIGIGYRHNWLNGDAIDRQTNRGISTLGFDWDVRLSRSMHLLLGVQGRAALLPTDVVGDEWSVSIPLRLGFALPGEQIAN